MPRPPRTSVRIEVDGRSLELSNLEKVFYPAAGFTKGHVIDYYTRAAPALLPHLRGRPLTLKRYPDGVDGPFFYEKECPSHRPDWVRTEAIWSRSNEREINFCVVDELPALVWAANLADLELHTSLALAESVEQPTLVAFDLDPGPPADVLDCARVALLLREVLDGLDLEAFPKTSGSKGMQVYLPLNTPATYEDTRPFAQALARLLEKRHPELVVSRMKKSLRGGKVFVDWSQNAEHKTTVCVYSLRARERPTVSTPLEWAEIEEAVESGDAELLSFDSGAALERIEERGELFAPLLELRQRLPTG